MKVLTTKFVPTGSVARLGVATLILRVLSTISAVTLFPFVLHHLGNQSTGVWATITGLGLASSIADLGVSQAIVGPVAAATDRSDLQAIRTFVASAVRAVSKTSLLLSATAVGFLFIDFRPMLKLTSDSGPSVGDVSGSWAILAFAIALGLPLGVAGKALFAMGRGDECLVIAAGAAVFQLASVLLVGFTVPSLLTFTAAVTLTSPLFVGVASWGRLRRLSISYDPRLSTSVQVKTLRRAGRDYFIGASSETIGYQLDPILIAVVLGATSVTAYSGAYRVYSFIPNMVLSVALPSWPKRHVLIAKYGPRSVLKTTRRYSMIGLLLIVPATLVLVVARNALFHTWTSGEITVGLTLAVVHLIFWPINFVRVNLVLTMYALGLERKVTYCTLAMLPVNVGLSIPLMHFMGVAGPLAASCIAQVLFAVLPYKRAIHTATGSRA